MDIPPEAILILIGARVVSKPVLKFIETISPALGRAYRPIEIIVEAKAQVRADKIKALGELDNQEAVELRKTEIAKSRAQRAADRNEFTENRRQANLEDIFQQVPEHLPEAVSDEKVDEDWMFQYIGNAQDISNKQMQQLWAKILAGEVAQPNSYSLRTLEALKTLSPKEAQTLAKVSQAAIYHLETSFILDATKHRNILKDEFDINFSDILVLREIGLTSSTNLTFNFEIVNNKNETLFFSHGDMGIVIEREIGAQKKVVSVELFTRVGSELLSLIDINPKVTYIQKFASLFDEPNAKKFYGKILSHEGRTVEIEDLKEL